MSDRPTGESDGWAAVVARRRALAEQLAGRPVEDVLGLVDPGGPGGWPEEGGGWTFHFTFHNWKAPQGPLKAEPLSVLFTTSRERFAALWEVVHAYSILRVRARVAEQSVIGTPQAQLVELLGPDDSDPELNRAAAKLREPVVHQDSDFGSFTLDRRANWYTAETEWGGTAVTLSLEPDGAGKLDAALDAARSLWKDQQAWAERISDYAVRELLPLKNDCWLEDGDAALTVGQFRDRMTLESVTVRPNGSFEFWHNDGDLFWGHWIQISGNLAEGPTGADIPG